ncbi:MAG: hypothetical protein H7Z42_14595 [Roseiflexaceae bacterium]|nr:hypothetical protein [Roseiflexaceae bacterium]
MAEGFINTRATSTDHISVNGTDYNLSDVKTVSLIRPVLNRGIGWGVAALGLVVLVLGYIVWQTLLPPMIGGVSLLIAGLVIALAVKPNYTVRMARAAGEPTLISFPTENSAREALVQIEAAVAKRRPANAAPLERELGA